MGGTTFMVSASGKTANEAFNKAREEALYEYGHRGYTGTIAEKDSFVNINLPAGTELTDENAQTFADKLIDEGDRRVDDKWGPAGCIFLGNGRYLFFGWASC